MGTVTIRKHLGSAQVQDTIAEKGSELYTATASAFLEFTADRTQPEHKGDHVPIDRPGKKNQSAAGKAALVRESVLFRGLSLTECEEVALRATEAHFEAGQIVFREGDPVNSISLVVCGRTKITQKSRSGGEVILHMRSKGEVLGGIGMMPGSAQFVTAQALEPCILMVWDSGVFEQLEERFPALRRNIVCIFAERLRSLEQQFLGIANEQVAPRLARTLVRLMEQSPIETRNAMRLDLSREELAQTTGTTPFTVGRLLSAWEERGILQIQRKSLTIQDQGGLISLAQARECAQ
jgi:CRP/FNR family transcriptional regulator, nitrogen oxide reductase regulator